MLAKYIIKQRT